jgi:hypothetical protein
VSKVPRVNRVLSRKATTAFLAAGALALGLVASVLGGCGGSASETPWPTEPDDVDLGPIGESQREEDPAQKSKDAAGDKDKKPEPEKPAGKKVDPVAP